MNKVEYIDKNAVKRLLPLHGPQDFVDPYEIPGFYEALDAVPVIGAIPIDFIESEKRFISELSSKACEAGNIERAEELSKVVLSLDALISNWGFIRGDEWRENRKKAEDGQQ